MQIKWYRDLKKKWCRIISVGVSGIALPESAHSSESVCKGSRMQLINSATIRN